MLQQRRDWVQQYRANYNGKIPDSLDKFYTRNDTDIPKEDDDRREEEKKNKKDKKLKDPKGKNKNRKERDADDEDEGQKQLKVGPSEVVSKFNEFYDDYSNVWENRDESYNRE